MPTSLSANEKLLHVLQEKKLISAEEAKEIKRQGDKTSASYGDTAINKAIVNDDVIAKVLSEITGYPFIDLANKKISEETLALIPNNLAKENRMIPFESNEREIHIATDRTDLKEVIPFLEKKTKKKIEVFQTSKSSLNDALRKYTPPLKERLKAVKMLIKEKGVRHKAEAIAQLLSDIIYTVATFHASDIHIEPQEDEVIIRARIDGVLNDLLFLPKSFEEVLITRIKVMSNLRTDEHRKPQDGRIKMDFPDLKLSLRVSIIPIYNGEKVVLRILASQTALNLETLGYTPEQLKTFSNAIQRTSGMILVTGPTGSGKTTTLYSALRVLNTRDVNISTIEDPVEIRLEGINQIQVNRDADLTFANGLRSILRQDPDIILVGEIRDTETANIAVNASLTGHLVFATLHTNDAASSLPRLLEMGVEHFLIASTVNLVIAQRLVRKNCSYCKEKTQSSVSELVRTFKIFDSFKEETITKAMPKWKENKTITTEKGKGCNACGNTGYLGRLAIAEVLEVDKEIRNLISQKTMASKIVEQGRKNGMITMMEDGFLKVLSGLTTADELLRITRE